MQSEKTKPGSGVQRAYNLTVAAVAGQVGCLTLAVVLAALFAGLWLDTRLGTRPWVTIGLLVASIPISLVVMFLVSRSAAEKLRSRFKTDQTENLSYQEDAIGKDS